MCCRVLTGIKFVSYDNAIHIQIQQNNFTQGALIHNESSWKELDTLYQDNATTKNMKFHYEPLHHDLKSIYLDDIIVPANTVVTGRNIYATFHIHKVLHFHDK